MGSTPFKKKEFTQAAFDQLLTWLDPDRDQAARKYEAIRARLIKIFTCRACLTPEDLADETIDRVILKQSELVGNYVGDPALYFYGVASNVLHEYFRVKPVPEPPIATHSSIESEQSYECLDHCMEQLPARTRQLILDYYSDEAESKIQHRKKLAATLGIPLNALRIKTCRIRESLFQCVQECLKRQAND